MKCLCGRSLKSRIESKAARMVRIPTLAATVLATVLSPLVHALSASEQSGNRPNIILVLADNLGYGDLGCYGQKRIKTPHLDRMAAEGMRFTQFYAGATICAPSRCVLMTGLHSGHCRIRGNHTNQHAQALKLDDRTLAEVLKGQGYRTAVIGKWGLGDEGNAGIPNLQGFHYFFGYLNQVHAHNYYPHFLWKNQRRVPLANVVKHPKKLYQSPELAGVATKRIEYAPDLCTTEALAFIKRQTKDQPFFLYLPYTYPHPNCESWLLERHGAEVPEFGIYARTDWPDVQKGHATMITRMDRDIGRILDLLRELGLDHNTLVLFNSDNGPHEGDGLDPEFNDSNGQLRGALRDMYEGGMRVPLIARWPGRVPAGQTSGYVGSSVDFMATFAELAGARPPGTDGISMLPTLLGREQQQKQHEYLYWEFYERGSAQGVRWGDWKAVRKPMITGPIELYDLQNDLGETSDVSAEHPDVVAKIGQITQAEHVPSPLWTAP